MTAETTPEAEPFDLDLSAEDIRLINDYMRDRPQLVLQIPFVRHLVASARIQRLNEADIRVFDTPTAGVIDNAIEHNMSGLETLVALDRPARLINPLRSIEYILVNQASMKVLTVGPRTEAELFCLVAAGFAPENIRGLDLISYSSLVDLGDMHDMPYDADSFDVIVLGAVLAYSSDNLKVAAEVRRVARPGAFIAVGCEFNPASNEELNAERPIRVDGTRFYTTEDVLRPFGDDVETVYFRHDIDPTLKDRGGFLMVIFRLAS